MANTNTTGIAYYSMPAYVALSGTSAQKIPWCYNATPVFANQTASSPSALFVQVDPDLATGSTFDGHPFIVRACGYAQVVATATVTIGLYNDASLTATAGNLVASTGASASTTGASTAYTPFFLEARLFWNSVSKNLFGFQQSVIGSTTSPAQTVLAPLTLATVSLVPAQSALQFSLGVTYSAGNTGSLVYITEFAVERV
jgi:hypothetical protein